VVGDGGADLREPLSSIRRRPIRRAVRAGLLVGVLSGLFAMHGLGMGHRSMLPTEMARAAAVVHLVPSHAHEAPAPAQMAHRLPAASSVASAGNTGPVDSMTDMAMCLAVLAGAALLLLALLARAGLPRGNRSPRRFGDTSARRRRGVRRRPRPSLLVLCVART
jgi:hypothetical protein